MSVLKYEAHQGGLTISRRQEKVQDFVDCSLLQSGSIPVGANHNPVGVDQSRYPRTGMEPVHICLEPLCTGLEFHHMSLEQPPQANGAIFMALESLQFGLIFFPCIVDFSFNGLVT